MPFNIDTLQIKSFIAIVDTGTFSQAALNVGRTQSALSLQIKRLEEALGCQLFSRATRRVTLTDEGEIFFSYAKQMAALQWEVFSRLKEPDIAGEIRFGTPEDFATHYLPDVLASFQKHHPRILLNVECDLTLNLMKGFERGDYDVILIKRDAQTVRGGSKVWREPLVWAAAAHYQADSPLSLVVSPQPCIYRARALAALNRAKKPWRISYTSPSLAGTLAAVRAGLGVTVLPANMIPHDIRPIAKEMKLPALADAEIALLKREHLTKAGEMFADYVTESLESKNY